MQDFLSCTKVFTINALYAILNIQTKTIFATKTQDFFRKHFKNRHYFAKMIYLNLKNRQRIMRLFNQIKHISRLSLYSPIYLLICGFVTYFSWMTGNSLLGMTILMLIMCVVLIINEDILPILPCLIYILFTVSDNNILNEDKTWPVMIVLAILLIGAFISHLISYPIKFKNYKLTIPLAAVTLALFAGGIGYASIKQYMFGIIFMFSLGPCMLIIYYLLRSYTRPPKSVDYKRYVCYIMLVLGLFVIAQMFTYFLRTDKPLVELIRIDIINLGWGNRNGIATLLAISAPTCFYLAFGSKRFAWLFYAIGLTFYACIVISFCRSGIFSIAITMPILLIYSFAKGANRSQLLITICVFAIAISSLVLIKMDTVSEILNRISDLTFTTTGRSALYEEALICFLTNPMFGVGMGYTGNNLHLADFCIYWFHCTPLQVIASMGIVGVMAYGYYYFVRGKIMFSNLRRFNITLSLGIIAFEIQSMMDAGSFLPFPYVLIIVVLTAMLEHNNSQESKVFMQSINIVKE